MEEVIAVDAPTPKQRRFIDYFAKLPSNTEALELRVVINQAASSPNVELKCMCARYKCYEVINYNSVCVNNCGLL